MSQRAPGGNHFVRTLFDVRRRHGVRAAICSALDRAASRSIGFCASHLFCYELDQFADYSIDEPDLSYRFLSPDEIRRFAADPSTELSCEFADRAAAGHDLCFGVLQRDRLAGYGWCAVGSIEPEHTGGIALSFPNDVGYMYKGFTHPDFRGRRLNGIRVALAGQALAKRGLRRLICLVDWTNWASIQSCRRGNCADLGLVVTCQIAGYRWWHVPDSARQLGLRFGNETKRTESCPAFAECGRRSESSQLSTT